MPVTGWKLDDADRKLLLERFAPRWPDLVADHVTLRSSKELEPLPVATSGEVVGIADDGEGLEALIVAIEGTTERPGGGTYHITWSLDRGRDRKPVESNTVIASRSWSRLPEAIPVRLIPARL